jgi:hypothetical protein
MAKNKKKKPQPQQKEIKKSDIADAAFKKKVTIINGCILLAFIIGLVSFLVYSWAQAESYPERFKAEVEAAKQAALDSNTSATAIAGQAKETADGAKKTAEAAAQAVAGLHKMATSGDLHDAANATTAKSAAGTDVPCLIFYCGTASDLV